MVFREVGAAIHAAFGRDVTGENFLQMADPQHRATRYRRIKELITHPCGSVRVGEIATPAGATHEIEFLSLPIASDATGLPSEVLTFGGIVGEEAIPSTVSSSDIRNLARQFSFVDIGVGVPEA